jgi:hypothetical protein
MLERPACTYICELRWRAATQQESEPMSTQTLTTLSTACLIACASAATAQTSTDKSFTAVANDCNSITWSEKALATYPTIASACQSVEERNGKRYVKFSGTLERNVNRGQQLVVNFKDGGKVTLTPPPETNIYVNGKKTAAADVERGSRLNFYIAEETSRLIIVPILLRDDSERLASLPSTAGPLPLLALGGFLSLGLGGLLRLYRRRR